MTIEYFVAMGKYYTHGKKLYILILTDRINDKLDLEGMVIGYGKYMYYVHQPTSLPALSATETVRLWTSGDCEDYNKFGFFPAIIAVLSATLNNRQQSLQSFPFTTIIAINTSFRLCSKLSNYSHRRFCGKYEVAGH